MQARIRSHVRRRTIIGMRRSGSWFPGGTRRPIGAGMACLHTPGCGTSNAAQCPRRRMRVEMRVSAS